MTGLYIISTLQFIMIVIIFIALINGELKGKTGDVGLTGLTGPVGPKGEDGQPGSIVYKNSKQIEPDIHIWEVWEDDRYLGVRVRENSIAFKNYLLFGKRLINPVTGVIKYS